MTTSGFLPPSSRHGRCRWRPHSSPTRRPTSDEPVKPTLSTTPASSAPARPSKVSAPVACTTLSTPSGRPAWVKSRASASPMAGAYSAGFQTAALPHRSAGTRYQAGTATGKLPAVTIAATPTGTRKRRAACRASRSARSGCRAGGPRPGRSRRCRRSRAPRPGPRRRARSRVTRRVARLGVRLHEPADVAHHAAADGRGDLGPGPLGRARRPARRHERAPVAQQDLGDGVVELGGVGGGGAPAGGAGFHPARDDGGDLRRGGGGHGGIVRQRCGRRRTDESLTAAISAQRRAPPRARVPLPSRTAVVALSPSSPSPLGGADALLKERLRAELSEARERTLALVSVPWPSPISTASTTRS